MRLRTQVLYAMAKAYRMKTRSIALTALFSAIILTEKILAPAPYDKLFSIFVQATLLALSFLIMGAAGPFSIGVLSGTLMAFARAEFAFMTFSLSIIYGTLLGLSAKALKVKSGATIDLKRLTLSSIISSAVVGSIGMSMTILLGLIPINLGLFVGMFVAGLAQGALGGYVAGILWRRYLFRMCS